MANDTFYAAWRDLSEIDAHMDWLRAGVPARARAVLRFLLLALSASALPRGGGGGIKG